MNLYFKNWFLEFQNYFGPVDGEPVNNRNFQARGVKSKYSAVDSPTLNLITRTFPDCLYLGKCKKGKPK